jgi:hypothetical protein
VGPRAGLEALVKRKIPSPCRESNHRSSSPDHSCYAVVILVNEGNGKSEVSVLFL